MTDMELLEDLAARIRATPPGARRRLVAIAGPPASGKSTLAADLARHLGDNAALVPMDGFHLDNRLLDAAGLRARKGAPETFDAAGFAHLIARLKSEDDVVLPVFDRTRDIAIAGAARVTRQVDTIIAEGNYLLLNRPPWDALHPLWDLAVFLKSDPETLRARLLDRWQTLDPETARAKIDCNDLPNARLVLDESAPADIML